MGVRLVRAALWRRRGTVALALCAVAIGASVASALLHVSGDIGHKLSRELRALGPNLLVVPAARVAADGAGGSRVGALGATLDEADARARLARAGVDGVPLLYVVARVRDEPVQIVGADLDAAPLAGGLAARWEEATGWTLLVLNGRSVDASITYDRNRVVSDQAAKPLAQDARKQLKRRKLGKELGKSAGQ
jgi:hypothetical protein